MSWPTTYNDDCNVNIVNSDSLNNDLKSIDRECFVEFDSCQGDNQLNLDVLPEHNDSIYLEEPAHQLEFDDCNRSNCSTNSNSKSDPNENNLTEPDCPIENDEFNNQHYPAKSDYNANVTDPFEYSQQHYKEEPVRQEEIDDFYCTSDTNMNMDTNTSERFEHLKEHYEEEPVRQQEIADFYYTSDTNTNKDTNKNELFEHLKESDVNSMDYQLKVDDFEEKPSNSSIAPEHTIVEEFDSRPISRKNTNERVKAFNKFEDQTSLLSTCHVCSKTVYPMEKLTLDSKCYHKQCFKCGKCGKLLSLAAASRLNNNIFCKPHYIELFRKRGRYDDICIDGEKQFDTGAHVSSRTYSNSDSGERKSSLSGYTCVAGDSPRYEITERKSTLDTDSCNRVANIRNAWLEGRHFNKNEWKNNNNNNQFPEQIPVKSGNKIKDIAALFESNQR